MYSLVIDTCTWINLGKKYAKVLPKISTLVEQEKAKLIVPEIVIQEWNRHKQDKVFESKKTSIQGMIKNAKTISQYLEHEQSVEFKKILENFQLQGEYIENLASEEVEAIDSLLEHPSTIKLPIEDSVKIQASELALAKKAPFGEKNSMADALILLAAINYISANGLENCIFISDNTDDFSSQGDKTKPHEDLSDLFDRNDVKYFINIGMAVNVIEQDLVSSEEIDEIEEELKAEILRKAFESYRQATTPIIETLQRQQQQFEEALKNPALEAFRKQQEQFEEAVYKQQQQLEEALKNPALEAVCKQQEQFEQTVRKQQQLEAALSNPALEAVRKQQQQLKAALSNPALEAFHKQQEQLKAALSNPALEAVRKQQQQLEEMLKSLLR